MDRTFSDSVECRKGGNSRHNIRVHNVHTGNLMTLEDLEEALRNTKDRKEYGSKEPNSEQIKAKVLHSSFVSCTF